MSLEDIIAEVRAVDARIEQLAAAGPRALAFPRHNAGPVTVSPDPSKPGRWRATRFDRDMDPVGHTEAADFRGALEAARHAGAIFEETQ